MKYFAIGMLLFFCIGVNAQNRITRYQYWFNGNYQGRQQVNISPAALVSFQGAFNTNGLSDGLNMLHLQFGDDSGRFSIPVSQYFFRRTPSSPATARVNAYQYWFDNNFSANVLLTVGPTSALNFSGSFDGVSLSNGLHFFHIRFRDQTNLWSSPVSQFFYKSGSKAGAAFNEVAAYQYWFDLDDQLAVTEQLSMQSVATFSGAIPLAGLGGGLHLMHLRFQDIKGHWSHTVSQFVYANPSASGTDSNLITKMQYWFDGDIQKGLIKYLAMQPLAEVSDFLSIETLPVGLHSMNLRFGDTTGHWTPTITQFFFKADGGNINNNVITGYRYWFNSDQQEKMVIHATSPQPLIALNTTIDMGCLTAGSNLIHLQFQDKRGLWSSGTTDTIAVFSFPSNIYRFTGNGNWSNPANWKDNYMPALDLPGCKEIIIDHSPGGACVLDVPQNLLKNAKLTVLPGKHLVVSQALRIK